MTGILPVNKPKGISSFDVIRDIKKMLPPELKKEKIGHGGTLDIPADGVLPVLFGEATKAFDFLLHSDKTYRAVIQFGAATDTDDADGKVIRTSDIKTNRAEIEKALLKFTGTIEQLPPKYSALRVNGARSYELAREEKEVELKPRSVTIYGLEIESFDEAAQRLALFVRCSSGTYIRSIARDIGEALGTAAHIAELRRTKSAGITLEQCFNLDELRKGDIRKMLLDLNGALDLPALELKAGKDHVMNGKPLTGPVFNDSPGGDGIYKIVQNGSLLAVAERRNGKMKYLRVFNG